MSRYSEACKAVYDAATEVWFASDVEYHAEGFPGLPGPAGNSTEPWNEDKACLESAIYTLQTVYERKYGKEKS